MNLIDYGYVRTQTKTITPDYEPPKFTPNTKVNKQYTDFKQYKEDVLFGMMNEKNTKVIVEQILGKSVKKYENKYSIFDFYIEKDDKLRMNIELKSRRNSSTAYATQLIGCNKIDKGRGLKQKFGDTYDTLYIFKLTDGIFYWLDDGSELDFVMKGNFQRGQKPNQLYLIPNSKLIRFEPSSP